MRWHCCSLAAMAFNLLRTTGILLKQHEAIGAVEKAAYIWKCQLNVILQAVHRLCRQQLQA
jgi:hypothetical protein